MTPLGTEESGHIREVAVMGGRYSLHMSQAAIKDGAYPSICSTK